MSDALRPIEGWFEQRGWRAFAFQRDVWRAFLAGESGLIHAATGTGKTYAAWLGAVAEWIDEAGDGWRDTKQPGLQVLWLTPLRALANDTVQALQQPLDDLGVPWTVEKRTGDVSSYRKQRQLKKPPSALVTTPESLSLLLSQPNSARIFRNLRLVIVDEWHELMGNKRGIQTELGLARLRQMRPALRIWGLSATLGNLDVALASLLGTERAGRLVEGHLAKEIVVDSLLPATIERFPWAGHLGLKMLPQVLAAIEEGRTALVFTNTRSQTERWYQEIVRARPDWIGDVALHHGSLALEKRTWVEDGLRAGRLRCVVCTSSLDLGVDFPTVDRVLQIGSPKGVARLLQRAGRSGHQPNAVSRVTCVPTHALQLIEVAAVRDAAAAGQIEPRMPPSKPLDVLVQHVVTIALGGGFEPQQLYEEVRQAYAFRELTFVEWEWVLDFVVNGGESLSAYEEYRRVEANNGLFKVADRQIARRHRMSIGTIVSDAQIRVKYLTGETLGTINESFISRLKAGDKFIFAGRPLKFVRVRDMIAYVRRAGNLRGAIPRWSGTTLPISQMLGDGVRQQLADAADGVFEAPELWAIKPILDLQRRWSHIPALDEMLIERFKTRDGYHLLIYPFAGRLVNNGLAALVAYRLAQRQPITFTLTANDYGFELLANEPLGAVDWPAIFTLDNLGEDIVASLNAAEMARRQFREVARVAGLVFQGIPGGRQNSARQLQASSNLFYDVFDKYDPNNLLLQQARREVLERQLDESRLALTLHRIAQGKIVEVDLKRPSPLGFPLLVERLSARLSSETLAERVRKLTERLEKWADKA